MLKFKDWQKEKDTLHRISQILGKHKLASAFQEPQWAHVVLDVTPRGFSTGMLFYETHTYSISVDLIDHNIQIHTDDELHYIDLVDGTTVKEYYEDIERILLECGIDVKINKKPQEVEDQTPFDEDERHHHYNQEISKKALNLMKFATRALSHFIAPFRARKVKPGLFWGTFDVSAIINYNESHVIFEPSQVIEYGAFDEHFIEFGFWFGDDTFKGPTFFILPYPFVTEEFTFDEPLIDKAYFDKKLTELIYELDDMTLDSLEELNTFFDQGFNIFKNHLEWENCQHYQIPLRMKHNQIVDKPL